MAPISFARGAPAPECLDPALIAECAAAALAKDGTTILSYGSGGGYGPLREILAARHGVEPGRVFVTTGGLQGFAFYAAVQLAAPAGPGPRRGADLRPPAEAARLGQGRGGHACRWTRRGWTSTRSRPSSRRAGRSRSSTRSRPSRTRRGRTLGVERRQRLAEIAAAHDLPVLEDDPYGLVRYDGEPLPSLHALEGGSRVAFTSSFSKTVAPGLRIGYFVLPADMVAAYDERAVSTYISPSLLPQATVAELIDRGAFEPNLERVRGLLKVRKDAMLAALERELPRRDELEPAGGRLLPLGRLRRGRRLGGAAGARDRGRGHVRQGRGLLPGRRRRPFVRAARVQLRDPRAHRRGRRAARLAPTVISAAVVRGCRRTASRRGTRARRRARSRRRATPPS